MDEIIDSIVKSGKSGSTVRNLSTQLDNAVSLKLDFGQNTPFPASEADLTCYTVVSIWGLNFIQGPGEAFLWL